MRNGPGVESPQEKRKEIEMNQYEYATYPPSHLPKINKNASAFLPASLGTCLKDEVNRVLSLKSTIS